MTNLTPNIMDTRCPSCGGNMKVEMGRLVCEFCGTTLAVQVETTTGEAPALVEEFTTATLTPAADCELVIVRIPAGEFLMGSEEDPLADENELPQHTVFLEEYWIGKTPVTVGQYRAFVMETGRNWTPPEDMTISEMHAVTNVSLEDALAFCEWAGRKSGRTVRLQSEAEWEKAGRGADGRMYPWGNEKITDAHTRESNYRYTNCPKRMGWLGPQRDSAYGVSELAGNVAEWTRSRYLPYPFNPGETDLKTGDRPAVVLRGTANPHNHDLLRCARRTVSSPEAGYFRQELGFRVSVMPGKAAPGGAAPLNSGVCPHCGAALKAGARFCPQCGKGVTASEINPAPAYICPGCGEKLRPGAKFCPQCGNKIP